MTRLWCVGRQWQGVADGYAWHQVGLAQPRKQADVLLVGCADWAVAG